VCLVNIEARIETEFHLENWRKDWRNWEMAVRPRKPAIATLLFAGFMALFLSWTKNKTFTLRFVQVVAFLFLRVSHVLDCDANALGLFPAIRLGISRSVRPALI
jgi:hypothetical protein